MTNIFTGVNPGGWEYTPHPPPPPPHTLLSEGGWPVEIKNPLFKEKYVLNQSRVKILKITENLTINIKKLTFLSVEIP